MKDFLNALETWALCLLLACSVAGLASSHGDQVSRKLDLPTWPPNDAKPATADARP